MIEKVQKLIDAGFIKKVNYPKWLANVVLIKKANEKWWMCVDFTNLNKTYPKNSYPLPHIDQLVDMTDGHELLTFMDTFLEYNQIQMAPKDEKKTSFITDRDLFCYKIMSFSLKNIGATYQWLVNKFFKDQIGRNIKVYINHMLVKSYISLNHIKDLDKTFATLHRYHMKLNIAKYAFGVTSGNFFGSMVSNWEIKANPEKILALIKMTTPKYVKEVQRLIKQIAILS